MQADITPGSKLTENVESQPKLDNQFHPHKILQFGTVNGYTFHPQKIPPYNAFGMCNPLSLQLTLVLAAIHCIAPPQQQLHTILSSGDHMIF